MNSVYACIKNTKCINIIVLNSDSEEFKSFIENLIFIGEAEEVVLLEDGFGIGDKYENKIWSKAELPTLAEPKEPAIENYLIDLDFRISKIELGLEV